MAVRIAAFISATMHTSITMLTYRHILYKDDILPTIMTVFVITYMYDLTAPLLLGQTFFHGWIIRDVYQHHVPFLFVTCLSYLFVPNNVHTKYFYLAWAFGATSSLNEGLNALGVSLNCQYSRSLNIGISLYAIFYFQVLSRLSILFSVNGIITAFKHDVQGKNFVLANSILCTTFAIWFYPSWTRSHYKRLRRYLTSYKK